MQPNPATTHNRRQLAKMENSKFKESCNSESLTLVENTALAATDRYIHLAQLRSLAARIVYARES